MKREECFKMFDDRMKAVFKSWGYDLHINPFTDIKFYSLKDESEMGRYKSFFTRGFSVQISRKEVSEKMLMKLEKSFNDEICEVKEKIDEYISWKEKGEVEFAKELNKRSSFPNQGKTHPYLTEVLGRDQLNLFGTPNN